MAVPKTRDRYTDLLSSQPPRLVRVMARGSRALKHQLNNTSLVLSDLLQGNDCMLMQNYS